MVQRRGIALVLSGLFLMSILPSFPSESFEPLQQNDGHLFEGISEDQISALEALPASVKVSGRTGNSTSPWGWAVKAGVTWHNGVNGIAVDSSGNAYVIGFFLETATFGGTSLTSSGDEDIFIAKLNSSGSWQWAVKAGGDDRDYGRGIAVDSSGNAYATGYFKGTATFGSTSLTSSGNADTFIAKLNSSGSWQWAVQSAGASSYDRALGIAVDSSGNAYVTGYFYDTVTFGSTSLTSSGSFDIFIAKLSSSGSWQWAVKAGGTLGDEGLKIAVDLSGNSYVTGTFLGTATFGSTSLTVSGGTFYQDIFISKLSSSGSWQWAVKVGGNSSERGNGIAVDSSGNAYVTGYFDGTATFGGTSLTSSGYFDIFIAKLSSSGSWQWAVKAGGTSNDRGNGIAVDSSGNTYVTGYFTETATFGSTNLTSSGGIDIFIAKLSSNGSWQWAVKAGGASEDIGSRIAVDSSGNAYATGTFLGTATFGSTNLTSTGSFPDIFIAIHQDQDMDGVSNTDDSCPNVTVNWISDSLTDYDSDGCRDVDEDDDDDNDDIADNRDACQKGVIGWTSGSSTDHDSDGCRDADEDDDDDDDGITDASDACEKGILGWTPDSSTDYDSDGCQDSGEDDDDDDDGITDASDACQKGDLGWTSGSSTDHDADGCQDSGEDDDDDADDVIDSGDLCPKGVVGWNSTSESDSDADGCLDMVEDFEPDDPLKYDDSTPIPNSSWNQWSLIDEDEGGGVLLLNIEWNAVEIDSIQRSDRPYFINLSRTYDQISSCSSDLQQFHSIDLRNDTLLQEQYIVSGLTDDVEIWICVSIIDWQDNVRSLGPVNVTPTPNMLPHYDGLITGSTVEVGAKWHIDLCAHFSDVETSCTDLRFTASNKKVAISSEGVASWTPTPSDAALTELTFTATDEKGLSTTSNEISIEVDESKELISFMGISITASDLPGIILSILGGGATVGLAIWRIRKAAKAKDRVRDLIIQVNQAGDVPTLTIIESKIDKMFMDKKLTNDDVALLSTKIRNRRDDVKDQSVTPAVQMIATQNIRKCLTCGSAMASSQQYCPNCGY